MTSQAVGHSCVTEHTHANIWVKYNASVLETWCIRSSQEKLKRVSEVDVIVFIYNFVLALPYSIR